MCTHEKGPLAGIKSEPFYKATVEAGPVLPAIEERHKFTEKPLSNDSNRFRVLTYNILADCYAMTGMYPYCPPNALALDYRKQLLNREILGYNSDIICLQEVEAKHYGLELGSFFKHHGFDGRYHRKGATFEGIATFYRREKFEKVEMSCVNLGNILTTMPQLAEIYDKIKDNAYVLQNMRLPTNLQVFHSNSYIESLQRLIRFPSGFHSEIERE